MSEFDSSAEERWAAAARIAEGVPDTGRNRRRRRTLSWVLALIGGSLAVGILLGVLLLPSGDEADSEGELSTGRLIAQFALLAAALIVGTAGFVWGRRTGRYVTRWSAVISPLNRAEKKSVARQIAGKEAVDRERLAVVLAIARQNRAATLGLIPIYAAIVLIVVATVISATIAVLVWIEVAALLGFAVAAVQLAVIYRRAGRFIARYSAPDAG